MYQVDLGDCWRVVRIPARRRFIKPAAEYANQNHAAKIHLAPGVIGYGASYGVIVCEWLKGYRSMTPMDVQDDRIRKRLAVTLATLHHQTPPFANHIDPAQALEWNLIKPATDDSRIKPLIGMAIERLEDIDPLQPVNCHGDPVCGNILIDTTSAMNGMIDCRLIDWEYSHISHPAIDLAIVLEDIGADKSSRHQFVSDYNRQVKTCGGQGVSINDVSRLRAVTALISAAFAINHNACPGDVERLIETAEQRLI
ncbi:MAG: hypothetical protein DHS20C01_10090 [marine bacterium B5-7]|nr:MAG: hypothetical protein DHS20C01_10090 [marine bacterium B5-7]